MMTPCHSPHDSTKSNSISISQKVMNIILTLLALNLISDRYNLKQYTLVTRSSKSSTAPATTTTTSKNISHSYRMLLRPENLQVIQRAPLVNLSFVPRDAKVISSTRNINATTPVVDPLTNLGYGARKSPADAYGTYVPDVTRLHKQAQSSHSTLFQITLNETEMESFCTSRGDDDYDYHALRRIRLAQQQPHQHIKLLCIVYSAHSSHDKIPILQQTWGHRCDGFMVGSDVTDPIVDAVDVQHAGKEEYKNMWQKVRSLWAFVYGQYYTQFDWFHMGGDDMWILVENLKAYLDSDEIRAATTGRSSNDDNKEGGSEIQVPLYLGQPLVQNGQGNSLYNTGGPGYTLNKAALKLLVTVGLPTWNIYQRNSAEDVRVAEVFQYMNVTPYWTQEHARCGQRYNHFGPGRHYGNHEPPFYKRSARSLKYTMGKNHSAVYPISFHYINRYDKDQLRRLHALVYGPCPRDTEKITST